MLRTLAPLRALAPVRAFALLCAIASMAVPAARAAVPGNPAVVAAPGSYQAPLYATPIVAITPASDAVLLNRDLALHNLASVSFGADDRPWCFVDPNSPPGPNNPRRFELGRCPLFFADDAQTSNGSSPVLGLSALVPGKTYAFACLIFPNMRGIFAVTTDPTS